VGSRAAKELDAGHATAASGGMVLAEANGPC
jgi:hypothetical protein